ncbi:MAG: DUF6515 family protein [Steroidobacteraceae bacterium]
MNNSIRRTLVLVTGIAAFGSAAATFAAGAGARDQALERREARQQSQPAAEAAQPAPQRQNGQSERGARPPQAQAQAQAQAQGQRQRQGQRDRGPQGYRQSPTQQAQVPGGIQRDRNGYTPNGGGVRGDATTRGYNNHGGNYYNGNRPRVVQQLPRGYRNYNWNGSSYYNYGGSWYRPYGGSYISIGVPYGLFVSSLPGYSSSFYYGNSRYYYYDDTYYMYEPARRGYVVTRSPYNDDPVESSDEQALDDDLYIYPAKGQSEQQQSDDRYECHRWAADETHYDPIEDTYQPDDRADYLRAMTACLTGRGYSVK